MLFCFSYEVEVRKSEMMKMMTSTVQNHKRMISVDLSESSRGREKAKNLSEIPLDYSNKILDSGTVILVYIVEHI